MTKRYCCDNLCHQGRYCPLNQPAEACTEVGQEDSDTVGNEDLFLAILIIVAVLCVLWLLWVVL